MKRRTFVKLALASFGTSAFGQSDKRRPRFLLVFLRGGYDCANVLVPRSEFYYESRPTIAVPQERTVRLDDAWSLHPALASSLQPLYEKREALFVPFAGTEDLTRSHFETQDSIELGQPLGGARYGSGFLDRLAGELGHPHPIAFTDQLPLVFRGPVEVPNVALRIAAPSRIDEHESALIEEMYRGNALAPQVKEGFQVQSELMRDFDAEMKAASRNAINARGFETQVRRIARLMKDEFDLGFVDVGGWDTHVAEGGAEGQLATRLQSLGEGLGAFTEAMGPAWRDTVVVVISEFGRTFRENGNRGTDHGHGTVYWLLGGGVRGGRIAGEQVTVRRDTLFQDRDFPVLNEYRSLLAGLFSRMYGLGPSQLGRVFPGAKPADLPLI